ncbi:MAG TPA: hypothetical protein VNA25_13495 [Phycisphaerae bacterium]|nr:hypothetical protein [Phycisphaerae bacterium]
MTLGIDHSLPRWLIDDTADISNARIFCVHTQFPRMIGELLPEDEAELESFQISGLPCHQVLCRIAATDQASYDQIVEMAADLAGSLAEAIDRHEAVRGQ